MREIRLSSGNAKLPRLLQSARQVGKVGGIRRRLPNSQERATAKVKPAINAKS